MSLKPSTGQNLVKTSSVPALLDRVRPAWQSKSLISRVRNLLEVDPSSACQRMFNAAIHDLREKISIAGVDIAGEAAKQNGLPPVTKAEDVENYPPAKLIDLAYRIGLLSRPDWRRVHRCYEIRRDLEHEDDEYEAGIEDCVYIFATCVEVILARDPIHLLRVTDIKALVQQATAVVPSIALLEDYERAPQPRQEEICKFLISIALEKGQSDLVQQNAYAFLQSVAPVTLNPVKLVLAGHLQEKISHAGSDIRLMRVASAAGVFPYLKQSHRAQFFSEMLRKMEATGYRWDAYAKHGDLLRDLIEVGGLNFCPVPTKAKLLRWLILLYIGEPGGRTSYGNIRHVFYSNSGAPLAAEIIKAAGQTIAEDINAAANDRKVAPLLENQHVARRYETLVDLVEAK